MSAMSAVVLYYLYATNYSRKMISQVQVTTRLMLKGYNIVTEVNCVSVQRTTMHINN